MKTMHIVLGVAAVAGIVWYVRRKQTSAPPATPAKVVDSVAVTGKIPTPQSEATKIIKLPDSLLVNTSGNTGIIPPVLKMGSTPVKVATPMSKPILKQTNLQGFALN